MAEMWWTGWLLCRTWGRKVGQRGRGHGAHGCPGMALGAPGERGQTFVTCHPPAPPPPAPFQQGMLVVPVVANLGPLENLKLSPNPEEVGDHTLGRGHRRSRPPSIPVPVRVPVPAGGGDLHAATGPPAAGGEPGLHAFPHAGPLRLHPACFPPWPPPRLGAHSHHHRAHPGAAGARALPQEDPRARPPPRRPSAQGLTPTFSQYLGCRLPFAALRGCCLLVWFVVFWGAWGSAPPCARGEGAAPGLSRTPRCCPACDTVIVVKSHVLNHLHHSLQLAGAGKSPPWGQGAAWLRGPGRGGEMGACGEPGPHPEASQPLAKPGHIALSQGASAPDFMTAAPQSRERSL